MSISQDLQYATQEYFLSTVKNQVGYKFPMLTQMTRRKKLREGGLCTTQDIQVADMESLVQEYGPDTGITGGSKNLLAQAKYNVSWNQIPIEMSKTELQFNSPISNAQIVDLAAFYGQQAIKGLRQRIHYRFHGCANDTELGTYVTNCQGWGSALRPTASWTYAGITRSATSNSEWMPAGYANTTTSYTLSKRVLREWIDEAEYYADEGGQMVVIMGSTLFRRLKAEFEASGTTYKVTGYKAVQGFDEMELDGVTIMEDPFLDNMTTTTVTHQDGTAAGLLGDMSACGSACGGNLASYDGSNVVLILNMGTWSFRYVPREYTTKQDVKKTDSMITVTKFVDQTEQEGGRPKYLAHAWWDCNLCCDQPNANLVRCNVS